MQNLVVLDAETSNSTYAETMKKVAPERFFEMYIAEQNMVGTALGLAKRGKVPFVSTFAAFFSRAFDQIRMSQYAGAHLVFVGSHAGVSIGEDGASQMALEDIALFRTVHGSSVLYPSDAVSTERCVAAAAQLDGLVYIRTTRKDTSILYEATEQFPVGGSKTLRTSSNDLVTLVGAGITVHEALAAHEQLLKKGIAARVIDLYSIKPIDADTLTKAAIDTGHILVLEDHYAEGGIAEAVRSALGDRAGIVTSLAVTKQPKSGTPEELLEYEGISAAAIVSAVTELLARK
jgi:transketolase